MGWEILGKATGGSGTMSATIEARKNIRVIFNQNSAVQCKIQFNDETGSNYNLRRSENGASDATPELNQTYMRNWNSGGATQRTTIMDIVNPSGKEKLCIIQTVESVSGSNNAPTRMESVGKFAVTSGQITKVSFVALSGTIDSNATLTVLGAKETATASSLSLDGGEDNTVTLSDDFSSDNFTNVGSQSGWGVSGGVMEWTTARGTTVQGEYIALPSTFSGNFVVRFKLTPTTVAYAGDPEEYLWMGLTNSNSCNSSTSQNQAGLYFHNYSTSDSKYQVTYKTNGGLFGGAVATSTDFSSTAYWVEIVKDGDSVKLTLYSDEYVTAVSGGTATSTAGGATDSYTHFVLTGMYHGSSTGTTSSLGTIDDLKIYKDVSQVRKGFTAKKNLHVEGILLGGARVEIEFNGDNGSNQYRNRWEYASGNSETENSAGSNNAINPTVATSPTVKQFELDTNNTASAYKHPIVYFSDNGATGAGSAPNYSFGAFKWSNNSDQITKIKVYSDNGTDYSEGSYITVWGDDGASDTTQPTIVNGFILEETDTGKHYIWNATTSTWTEIV